MSLSTSLHLLVQHSRPSRQFPHRKHLQVYLMGPFLSLKQGRSRLATGLRSPEPSSRSWTPGLDWFEREVLPFRAAVDDTSPWAWGQTGGNGSLTSSPSLHLDSQIQSQRCGSRPYIFSSWRKKEG